MNKAAFFGLLLFTLGIQVGLQVYLAHRKPAVAVVAHKSAVVEVNFIEQEKPEEKLTTLETSHARMVFSSHGATLSSLTYLRMMEGKQQEMVIISPEDAQERKQQAFMVALDTQTPYIYDFKDMQEIEGAYVVSYEASTPDGKVEKQFTVYKNRMQIDLALTLKPKNALQARVIWPSPVLKGLPEDEVIQAVVINEKKSFKKIAQEKITPEITFEHPSLFGSEDKYFVFALVKDAQAFAQNAYYKVVDQRTLSFLEGPVVEKETTWNFSFYFGPKDAKVMALVDKHLENVFDYGIFSIITKPLLKVLDVINGVVHNYGIAILLLTLLLKIMLLPFSWSGTKKMKKLQDYSKKMEYLNKVYKNDPEGLNNARAELLKTQGMPSMGGCLPLLLQIPFFMALNSGLNNSLELYKAPFIFWIQDLSMPDPYYVLPFLVVIFYLIGVASQKGGARQKIGQMAMGLVFGAFTSTFSAGLCLYIGLNFGLQMLQTELQKAFEA